MTGPFTDHHVHLMSTAAARLSADVSPARDLAELGDIVRARAERETGGWLRAWGYEEWALTERRHPSRHDLDRIVRDRPVVLHHRTGHAAVLNSVALDEVGAGQHPDGILFDRHDLLSRVPRIAPRELRAAVGAVSREWSEAGVGQITDATHTNGPEQLGALAGWAADGHIEQAVTAMVSPEAVGSVPAYGARLGSVRVGWVKLMPSTASAAELTVSVRRAHEAGYPVAVHVTEIDVLEAALAALEGSTPPDGTVDRIEHNALSLPEQVTRVASLGAAVVVNPGFLVHRRGKYEEEIGEVERPWLVRIASLLRAGIAVRAGSDSPVTPLRPRDIITAATHHPFAPTESISRDEAERLLAPWPEDGYEDA